MRADLFLVEQGYAKSRSEAQAAIRLGRVRADGVIIAKPAQPIAPGVAIAYEPPHPFVSRGGVKLKAALTHFSLSPRDRICVDLGASTGGFTQVLLEEGAAKVYAVDVGRGQMDKILVDDPRVTRREGLNARELSAADVPGAIHAVTADLSFISLELALPPALSLAAPDAWLVSLIKPQFEVGRAAIGKGGVVRDEKARAASIAKIADFIGGQPGWRILGKIESPITGSDGNAEYLLAAVKS
ncbi:MAG TPA: TlyA family RNA methyltransferase [Rhizomicrobium sp.]|nr:TlyA family RNA methyltransferase [Rhizomicrobium sp.]